MHLANGTNDIQVVYNVCEYRVENLMIWVFVNNAITLRKSTTNILMCTVHRIQVEKEIKIPRGEVHYILLHASAKVQIIDDENMRSI